MTYAKRGDLPQSLNAATFTRRELTELVEDLAAAETTDERKKLPGIDSARADILLGGAIVLEQVCERIGLDDSDRELLEAAALLANSGLFISHSRHHKHSYYVIRNTEHLMGFTDREIELIALTARYHRKSVPSEDKHPEFAVLTDEDRLLVRRLAALLRVAIGMD